MRCPRCQTPRLPGPPVSAAPVPGPVLRARDFSSGDLLCPSSSPGAASWLYLGFDFCLSKSSHSVVLWPLSDPMCVARAAMVGGAGFEREVSYGTAIGCVLVVTYYECAERQPRLTTSCSTRQLAWMPG